MSLRLSAAWYKRVRVPATFTGRDAVSVFLAAQDLVAAPV